MLIFHLMKHEQFHSQFALNALPISKATTLNQAQGERHKLDVWSSFSNRQ